MSKAHTSIHPPDNALSMQKNNDVMFTVGTQDTGRRQAHTKQRKHKQNGTQLKPGMNLGVLEVLAIIVSYKTPVKLFKMCWSPLWANIPK
jgi:hypothetical protein